MTAGGWTRRRLLKTAALSAGAAIAGGVTWSRMIEPRWLAVRRVDLALPGLAPDATLRIAQLSDFHWSSVVPRELIEAAIDSAIVERPDLVCLTGDYVTAADRRAFDGYGRLLGRLASTAPCFAVLGNHDGGLWCGVRGGFATTEVVTSLLRDAGITVLANHAVRFAAGAAAITLVGLDDVLSGSFDADAAYGSLPAGEAEAPVVLLSHNPDSKAYVADRPWNLLLAGHTHGGQVVLPWLGAPVASVMDRRYLGGLGVWNGRPIHVSRGVGNLHGVRFNCRPEITILTLRGVREGAGR